MKKHSSPNPDRTTAAYRQANYRARALARYGVKPVTLLLSPAEEHYLRTAYRRRYGHAPSIGARVAYASRPKQQPTPTQPAQVGQLDLL